ncbi:MAG: alpha/beta hydrolase family protein [Candidatus Hodarchaeota archaeon]
MEKKTRKYLLLRMISTLIGVSIVIANLWLWHVDPDEVLDFYRDDPVEFSWAVVYGFQTFLFAYIAFMFADSIGRFWWHRWKYTDASDVSSERLILNINGGRKVSGVIHHNKDGTTKKCGFIIVSYGLNDNQQRAHHIARALAVAGFTVFTWDYRGKGKNKGRITDFTGHIEDLSNLIDYWHEHSDGSNSRIHLCGWSLGGMVSIIAGLDNEKIEKIFTWSTWSDLRKNVLWKTYVNPFAFLRYLFKGQLMVVSKDQNEKISPLHYFKRLSGNFESKEKFLSFTRERLFICHSKDDDIISFKNFEENAEFLEFTEDNYFIFQRGSHLMLRKEPVLIGLIHKFFKGAGGK